MELPGLQMSHNIQLRLRVVGDQNANHVLIRVRHRSRTSTRWPHPHLGTTLPLAPSEQFRTETTSFLTTIIHLIVDSTHSSAFFRRNLELINDVLVRVHGRPIF